MSDIALVQIIDPTNGPRFDFALSGGDLKLDAGLITPVVLSLFCDRLAAADDTIPDGTKDRRGWWADLPVDGTKPDEADLFGSRLWLLSRTTATDQTRTLAEHYAGEALGWLTTAGVVGGTTETATISAIGRIDLVVDVAKTTNANSASKKYNTIWKGTL